MNTKRSGTRKLISSNKVVVRLACRDCLFVGPVRSLPHLHETTNECLQITRESLERASVRILSRRYQRSKNTVMEIIHRITSVLADSVTIARRFRPAWSGVLVFDGKVIRVFDQLATRLNKNHFTENELRWMHKMRWLCGIDYITGDLPHYALHEAESRIDLILYFQKLKEIRYPLKALVCDGNSDIPHAAKFVFGNEIIVQRCTRHFAEDLRSLLPSQKGHEQERLLCLEVIKKIQCVIEADTLEIAQANLLTLSQFIRRKRSSVMRTMVRMFQENSETLCAHHLYPELHLPHTSNDIESLFKQLNLRLKSLGRFAHRIYAENYLNAWALLRRFTPFTDCRKPRQQRNGKAPLELAGATITGIDPLRLQK